MLTQTKARSGALQGGRVVFLPLSSIRPNPAQPRTIFDAQGLQELAASIRQYGVLQPLTVRKKAGFFELVAGERPIARSGSCRALRGAVSACERRRSGCGASGAR